MYIADRYASNYILATDTSKDASKTAIAAINITINVHAACLVHQVNSVFTAEALTVHITLMKLLSAGNEYVILTDSKSVLTALLNINPLSVMIFLTMVF